MISAIVAVDYSWGIGYKGNLLEYIPEDLQYFKALTTNNVVIMGQNTWDSLPKKPLPNRGNIVITYDLHDSNDANFWSMDKAKDFMLEHKDINFFIIGGGSIYEQLLPICDKVYITKIHKNHENVDTYFPNLDKKENEWKQIPLDTLKKHKDFLYQFCLYERV